VMIEQTIDEFALLVSQKTGMSFDFLTHLKHPTMSRVMQGKVTQPGQCQGRTKFGAACRKRTLVRYCHDHRDQERQLDEKKRRLDAHMHTSRGPSHAMIRPCRFQFS
jgi:hypothetical protein